MTKKMPKPGCEWKLWFSGIQTWSKLDGSNLTVEKGVFKHSSESNITPNSNSFPDLSVIFALVVFFQI